VIEYGCRCCDARVREFCNTFGLIADDDQRRAPVRFNIVSPGVVRTPLWANMAEADRGALYQQTAERLRPRWRRDRDRRSLRQSYSTGQVHVVDGGAVLV
jgi:NAD(P)-dependent dehydrogenase (short-subunit alcohol dehydrogenase family)